MQRRKSKSTKKPIKRRSSALKEQCGMCQIKNRVVIQMQHALYRKYSSQHYSHLELIDREISKNKKPQKEEELMEKYYGSVQIRHQLYQIKDIYKLHTQSPRLFLPGVLDILSKCHHRKRLLQYFKIAKILGLKVQSVKFSTFLLSISKTRNPDVLKKSYDRIIGQISGYQFSEEIQKQLLDTLEKKPSPKPQTNLPRTTLAQKQSKIVSSVKAGEKKKQITSPQRKQKPLQKGKEIAPKISNDKRRTLGKNQIKNSKGMSRVTPSNHKEINASPATTRKVPIFGRTL